jgi:hypothetical protein
VFSIGNFGMWLDHEGCDLMNGLIHWWIHSLICYLEVV